MAFTPSASGLVLYAQFNGPEKGLCGMKMACCSQRMSNWVLPLRSFLMTRGQAGRVIRRGMPQRRSGSLLGDCGSGCYQRRVLVLFST